MNKNLMFRFVYVPAIAAMLFTGTSLSASETDKQIETSFKKTYVYKTYLKDDSISIDSKEGVVTLTGTVADPANKTLAEDTAASLTAVTRVDNQLLTKAEAAAENADTWIGRKVKLTLFFHRNVDAGKTVVEVKDCVVTLKGVASSMAQKELTAAYAADIEGVKRVQNEMTVVESTKKVEPLSDGEKMDDASITAQVKLALVNHRSTSSLKTKVTTRNGEVTLTGIAKNDAEKALVSKLVNDIQGVSDVKNQMTVE